MADVIILILAPLLVAISLLIIARGLSTGVMLNPLGEGHIRRKENPGEFWVMITVNAIVASFGAYTTAWWFS